MLKKDKQQVGMVFIFVMHILSLKIKCFYIVNILKKSVKISGKYLLFMLLSF